MASQKILIVGAGSMGSALVKGLSEANTNFEIHVCDLHVERTETLCKKSGATQVNNLKDAKGPFAAIVLCVKPHDLASVASQLGSLSAQKGLVILSTMAGIPCTSIAEQLQGTPEVVRTMPNIAAHVGAAATAMCCKGPLSEAHRLLAETIMSSVGDTSWVDESLMDAVTGLSGSGPAYIYMVIEALIDGGVMMGIPRELSRSLSVQTVLGAAKLVKESGLHPAILKDQVTTPAGTTIHAVQELEAHGLRSMLMSAVATATKQSTALAQRKKI